MTTFGAKWTWVARRKSIPTKLEIVRDYRFLASFEVNAVSAYAV